MKQFTEFIPCCKNFTFVKDLPLYDDLGKIPHGKFAREFLEKCENGDISPKALKEFMKNPKYVDAVKCIKKVHPPASIKNLLGYTTFMWRLRKFGRNIPWELVEKAYPCMGGKVKEDDDFCLNKCSLGGAASVLDGILFRADLLSRRGGYFADRLMTAIRLGVPYELIEKSKDINLPVALEILKEFFPECDENWVRDMTERNRKELTKPSKSQGSDKN